MARYIGDRLIGFIEEKIERRLGLVIHREKTRVVQLHDGKATLDFLGYQFRFSRSHRRGGGPRYWRFEASPKSLKRARERIHYLTSAKLCFAPVKSVVESINVFLRGWLSYFSKGYPANARWNLVRFAEDRIAVHLRRRSQRPYRPPNGVSLQQHAHDLGLIALRGARG